MVNLTKKEKHIVEMYVRYFGRVATEDEIRSFDDVKKLSTITAEVRVNAANESGLKGSDYLNSIIQNLFGRDANPKELKYVKTIENNKNLPIETIIKNGSRDDKAVYQTKKAVALFIAEEGSTTNFDLDKITKDTYAEIYNPKTKKLLVDSVAELETKIDAIPDNGNATGKTFMLTTSTTVPDTLVGTAKSDLFNATTLNTLQKGDVLLDTTTTDSDILNAAVTTATVAARIQNIETINVTGEYVNTGLDLTNVSGTKTLNLDTKLAGGTAKVTNANSINAAAIKAGANISTLDIESLTSGTRDTVTVDGGNANVKLTGNAGGADKYSVTVAKDKTLTANAMNTSGDELTVNASNNFTLTTGAAIPTATINNTGSAAITVTKTGTASATDKLALSGNDIVIKDATTNATAVAGTTTTGATAGVEVTSTATKSTIELSHATNIGTAVLNKAQVSEVLVSGAGTTSITVNENSKLVLAKDQASIVVANIDNAKGDLTTGTLLLDVNANQTTSVATGAKVDTVLLTAGKLADKDGKAQTVTIKDFITHANTDTIVVNGANDLIISKLTGTANELISATAHTGKLTINDFTEATKVFSGSNNDTFKVTTGTGKVLEISSGAGNDTVDLGASTVANKINLGEGDDTITFGTAARGVNEITLGAGKDTVVFAASTAATASTIKDAVIGEDKIILTGAANNTAALNVAALGAITEGVYGVFGPAHKFTLTGSTASDLSNLVQFGKQAVAATATTAAVAEVAYTAAANLDLTTGSFNDVVVTAAAGTTGNINLGAGDDKITTNGAVTGTITGGAGSDTFVIGHATTKIADLGATDILKVTAGVAVAVDVVESFTATAATTNATAATTTLNLKDGVNVDMTLATLDAAGGYTIKTDSAVTTGATIVGSRGVDIITGSKFADKITGGEGADTLTGGLGADTLTGGLGADIFVVAAQTTAAGIDHITDFVGGTDKLKTGITPATAALTDLTTSDFSAAANLAAAASAAVAAAGNYATAGDAVMFTYASKSYITVNDGTNTTFTDGTDVLVEITGYTGTIVLADIIA